MSARPARLASLVACAAIAAGVAACGSAGQASGGSSGSAPSHVTSSSAPSSVTVKSAKVGSLGTVLVNRQGDTLYIFVPDDHHKVTCNGSCQSVWPAEAAPASGAAKAGSGVQASLLGSDANPIGGKVVTYNGWPLYTYVSDAAPGQDSGQALNLNGGLWYVIRPSGEVEK